MKLDIPIEQSNEGYTAFKFLRKKYKKLPLSVLEKLFRKKDIGLNQVRIGKDMILTAQDILSLYITEDMKSFFVIQKQKQKTLHKKLHDIAKILHEDDDIIVVSKRVGMRVHTGGKKENKKLLTLTDYLRQYCPLEGIFKPSFVHRLDKDTSGIILAAKTPQAARFYTNAFKAHQISKKYMALVRGTLKKPQGTITKSLDTLNVKIGTQQTSSEGKAAITHYQVKEMFDNMSLVELSIETGRKHQIRVHLQSMGHPVVGDYLYGDKKWNDMMKKQGYDRLYLHACSLIIPSLHDQTTKLTFQNNPSF